MKHRSTRGQDAEVPAHLAAVLVHCERHAVHGKRPAGVVIAERGAW